MSQQAVRPDDLETINKLLGEGYLFANMQVSNQFVVLEKEVTNG